MKTSQTNISQIRELIADNHIKEAFSQARSLFENTPFFNQFLLLSSKYNEANQALRLDLLSFENASIEKSKAIQGFLSILSELDSSMTVKPSAQAPETKKEAAPQEEKTSNTLTGDGNIVISNASNNQININK